MRSICTSVCASARPPTAPSAGDEGELDVNAAIGAVVAIAVDVVTTAAGDPNRLPLPMLPVTVAAVAAVAAAMTGDCTSGEPVALEPPLTLPADA